jgi:tetratricopeptide (TPR) repeat protein
MELSARGKMMARHSSLSRSFAVCLALVGVCAMVMIAAPPAAYAAPQPLSPSVGKPLQEAQQLAKNGDLDGALQKAKQAQAITPKTPYEAFVVNEFLAYIYTRQRDYKDAITAYEASLRSGQYPPSEKGRRIKTLAQLSFQIRDYARTIQYANQYLKEVGPDPDLQLLVANCYYQEHNFSQALATSKAILDAADASGKPPGKSALALFLSSAYQLHDNASIKRALFRMVELYPNDAYWETLVKLIASQGLSDYTSLDLQRLELKIGLLRTDDDYFELGKQAFALNLPGDALTIMHIGFQKRILSAAPGGRDMKLFALVKEAAIKDLAALPADTASAAATPSPNDDILVGQRYASFGQFDKAIPIIAHALSRPGVTNPDQAHLELGRILLLAGRPDQAHREFEAIKGEDGTRDVAHLYTVAG